MFNAIERLAVIARAVKTEAGVEQGMPRQRHATGLSLFAMAAWIRMAMGLSALLFLWLVILWATRV